MPIDIWDYDGTIQSRGAKIKRIRKLYSRSQEERIYKKAIELLNETFPELVKLEDISILESRGRVFLTDYEESASHKGEQYGKTADVSTKFPIFGGNIDVTMLHELIHKYTFVKGIITEEDFEKNSAFYEGATELSAQKAFNRGLRKESTTDHGYRVNLSGDVAYTSQVALLNQLDILLGGDFVEASIFTDKNALKREMIAQFGEDNYTFIWNRIADTRNARNDMSLIIDATDDVQRAIIENCLPQKLRTLKTKEEFEEFFETVRAIGDARLTNDKNIEEFENQYKKYITYARKSAEVQGIDTSFLDKYSEYKYSLYEKTDELYLAFLDAGKNNGRRKENLLFEHANHTKKFFMDENLDEIPQNVETYGDFTSDDPMVLTFRDGELLSVTKRDRGYMYYEEFSSLDVDSYGAYVGRVPKSDETAKKIFETEDVSNLYRAKRTPNGYSTFGKEHPVDDYYLLKDDAVIIVESDSRGYRRTRSVKRLSEEESLDVFDAIRSSIEIPKYFQEQKKVLEKTLGITFYREDR